MHARRYLDKLVCFRKRVAQDDLGQNGIFTPQ
jgi:hypothetical protein